MYALKLDFSWGQFYKKILKFGCFKNLKKSEKVGVAEIFSYKNDIFLSNVKV